MKLEMSLLSKGTHFRCLSFMLSLLRHSSKTQMWPPKLLTLKVNATGKMLRQIVFLAGGSNEKWVALHISNSPWLGRVHPAWTKNTEWHRAGSGKIPTSTPKQSTCCYWVLWRWCHWMLPTTELLYHKWKGLKSNWGTPLCRDWSLSGKSSVIDVSELESGLQGKELWNLGSIWLFWSGLLYE